MNLRIRWDLKLLVLYSGQNVAFWANTLAIIFLTGDAEPWYYMFMSASRSRHTNLWPAKLFFQIRWQMTFHWWKSQVGIPFHVNGQTWDTTLIFIYIYIYIYHAWQEKGLVVGWRKCISYSTSSQDEIRRRDYALTQTHRIKSLQCRRQAQEASSIGLWGPIKWDKVDVGQM
jgi:hypothetical protein